MSQPWCWPRCWKSCVFLLGSFSLLPTWGLAEGTFGGGQKDGLAVNGRGTVDPSASDRSADDRSASDRSIRDIPFPMRGGESGASGRDAVYGGKGSLPGRSAASPVGEQRGGGLNSQGAGRYWDPPPGFRGDDAGEGAMAVPKGYDSGKVPDRLNGYGNDGALGSPGLESSREPSVRGAGGPDGFFPSDSAVDSETLDPRREIDPYFLRKQQGNGYSGSQAVWGSGRDSRSTGYRSGGYDGGDAYRMNQAAPFRYDDPVEGGSRYRDGGPPSDGRGVSGYRGYGETDSYPNGYSNGSGPYRFRGGEDSVGRESGRGRYDGSGVNGSNGSFSWNGNSDWGGRGDRGWMSNPWNSSSGDWMRPWDGWRSGDGGRVLADDPTLRPDDFYLNEGMGRGPWR